MSVDLSVALRSRIEEDLERAGKAEARGDYERARICYLSAAEAYHKLAKQSKVAAVKKERLKVARKLIEKANRMKDHAAGRQLETSGGGGGNTESRDDAGDMTGVVRELIRKADVKWSDIGGLEEVKSEIKSLFGISMAKTPQGVDLGRPGNILLYGPPGTGKTLLAAATSNSLAATFFSVNTGDLLSKYFGESSKTVSALFREARRLSPSVVFMDEVESLAASRDDMQSGAEGRVLGQLLAELDGLSSKGSKDFVLVMAATNLPWRLDAAILSRFPRQIYVPLPDKEARKKILRVLLDGRGLKVDLDLDELAALADGLSGREMEHLCGQATRMMLERCNPGLESLADRGIDAVREYELKVAPIARREFESARRRIRPATDPDLLRRYRQWSGGATRR